MKDQIRQFQLTDLQSVGRGKRTDCDLDNHVEDGGTNDSTSANISLDIETIVMLPAGVCICPENLISSGPRFLSCKNKNKMYIE